MENVEALKSALDRVIQEVAETAAAVNDLKQQIADLKEKIGNVPELEAAIDDATVKAGQIADALDALQPKAEPEPTPEPEPEV